MIIIIFSVNFRVSKMGITPDLVASKNKIRLFVYPSKLTSIEKICVCFVNRANTGNSN